MRLVVAGHDFGLIERGWTLGMVLKTNEAMDIQEEANSKAIQAAKSKKED